MKTVIVTGGIGSGKSVVCDIMKSRGFKAFYNADERVKSLYVRDKQLLSDIESALDCRLRDGDGAFMPAKLAGLIFSDPEALMKVESLVFPALIKDYEAWKFSHEGEEYVFFESATILEKPYFAGFGDFIIFVDAPYEKRLERACARDGADRDRVEARMRNQKMMNDGSAAAVADFVIVNDSTREALEIEIDKALNKLTDYED